MRIKLVFDQIKNNFVIYLIFFIILTIAISFLIRYVSDFKAKIKWSVINALCIVGLLCFSFTPPFQTAPIDAKLRIMPIQDLSTKNKNMPAFIKDTDFVLPETDYTPSSHFYTSNDSVVAKIESPSSIMELLSFVQWDPFLSIFEDYNRMQLSYFFSDTDLSIFFYFTIEHLIKFFIFIPIFNLLYSMTHFSIKKSCFFVIGLVFCVEFIKLLLLYFSNVFFQPVSTANIFESSFGVLFFAGVLYIIDKYFIIGDI